MDENISWNPLINWSENKSISHNELSFKKTSKPATEANTVKTRWNRQIDTMSQIETEFWNPEIDSDGHFQPIAPLMQQVNNQNLQNVDSAPPYTCYKSTQINWTDSFQKPNSGLEDTRNLPPKVIECEGKVFEYSHVVYDMMGTVKAGIIHLEGDVQVVKCFFSERDLWGCCPEEVCVGTMVGVNARLLPSHERIQGIDYMAASVWRLGMRIPPILTARLIEAVDHRDLDRYKVLAPQLDLRNLMAQQKLRKICKEDNYGKKRHSRSRSRSKLGGRKGDGDYGRRSRSRGRKRPRSRSRGESWSRCNGRSRSCSRGRTKSRSRERFTSHSRGRTRSRSRERSSYRSRGRAKRSRSKSGESSTGRSHGGYSRGKDRNRTRKRSTSSKQRKRSRSRSESKRRAPIKRESRSSSLEFARSVKSSKENYRKLPIPPPVPAKPRLERGFQFAPVLRESWKLQLPAPVPSQSCFPAPLVQKTMGNCSRDRFGKNQTQTPIVKDCLTLPRAQVSATKPRSVPKHFDWFHNGKEWVYATEQPPLVHGFEKMDHKSKCAVCNSNYDCSDSTFAGSDYNVHTSGVIHRIAAAGVEHLSFETPMFSVLARGSVMCNVCSLELETANVIEGHLETSLHALNIRTFVTAKSASAEELQVVYGRQAIYGAPVPTVSNGDNVPENREFTAFGKWPKIKKSSKKSVKDLDEDNVPENREFTAFGKWPKIKKSSKKSVKDLAERAEHKSSKKKKKKVEKMAKKIVSKIINKAVETSILKTINYRRKMICQTNDEAVKTGTFKNINFRPMFQSTRSVILKLKPHVLSESMICNLCGVSVTWTEPHNLVKRNLAVKKHKMSNDHSVHVKNAETRADDDEEHLVYSDELGEWLKDTLPKTEEILTVCFETLDDDSVICLACPMCPPMMKNVAENVHIQTAKHIENMQLFYGNDEIEKMGWYPTMAEDYFKLEVGQDADTDVEFVCVKEKQQKCNFVSWDVAKFVLNEVLLNIDNYCREKEETNGGEAYTEDPRIRHPEVCSSFDTSNVIVATDFNETSALLDLIQQKRATLELIDALFKDLIANIVDTEDCRLPARPVEDTSEWGEWIEKCFYCAKRHAGVNVCAAKVKTCKFCKNVGHLERIHLEQDAAAREEILSALNSNDTGDVFSGVSVWTDYRPQRPVWKVDPRKTNLLVLEI